MYQGSESFPQAVQVKGHYNKKPLNVIITFGSNPLCWKSKKSLYARTEELQTCCQEWLL